MNCKVTTTGFSIKIFAQRKCIGTAVKIGEQEKLTRSRIAVAYNVTVTNVPCFVEANCTSAKNSCTVINKHVGITKPVSTIYIEIIPGNGKNIISLLGNAEAVIDAGLISYASMLDSMIYDATVLGEHGIDAFAHTNIYKAFSMQGILKKISQFFSLP